MKKRDENSRLAGFWLVLTALVLAFGSPACVDEDSSDDDTDAGADASSDTDTDSDKEGSEPGKSP